MEEKIKAKIVLLTEDAQWVARFFHILLP